MKVDTYDSRIYAAAQIGDFDIPLGAVIITSYIHSINKILLDHSGHGNTGEIYLVNYDYLMITESRFISHAQYTQKVDTLGVKNCIKGSENTVGQYLDYRGTPIFGATYCAPGFILLAEIDSDEVLEPLIQLQNQLVIISPIIIMMMGAIAFFTSRKISGSLVKLTDAAKNIAEGRLDVNTGIDSADEIGQLSVAVDSMAKKLKEQIKIIKQKEDVISYEEDILLRFSKVSETDCVCLIDIIDSTKITQNLSDSMSAKLYETFLNEIAEIVKKFEGVVIKNIGDALLFSFTIHDKSKLSISNAIDCCIDICESHGMISDTLENIGLPQVNYRVSIALGLVRVASSTTSNVRDIFGSTVNRCSKINHMAHRNGIICDEGLYKAVNSIEKYNFESIHNETISQYGYVVYHLGKK